MARTRTVNGTEYTVSDAHPAAELLPWMSDEELTRLAADIGKVGQRESIKRIVGSTLVIDGRNRELACAMTGAKPWYEYLDLSEDAIVAYVLSLNIPRRHLTPSQLAMAAADLANLKYGTNQHTKGKEELHRCNSSPVTQADAAEMMGVSPRSVASAVKVKHDAPELAQAVRDGDLDVKTAAKVADLPEKQRQKVAKADDPKAEAKKQLAKKPEAVPGGALVKDGLGAFVPKGLSDTFADPTLAEAIARIEAVRKELLSIEKHVVGTLARKGEFWPYALFGECAKALQVTALRAEEAAAHLAAGVPFCVCPHCKGDGCAECRNSGAWPKHRYENREQYGVQ